MKILTLASYFVAAILFFGGSYFMVQSCSDLGSGGDEVAVVDTLEAKSERPTFDCPLNDAHTRAVYKRVKELTKLDTVEILGIWHYEDKFGIPFRVKKEGGWLYSEALINKPCTIDSFTFRR